MPSEPRTIRYLRAAEALCGLGAARLVLAMLPYRVWRRVLDLEAKGAAAQSVVAERDVLRARRVGHSITRVAALVPFRSDCLPQAIAARFMLWRRRIPSTAKLGARADPDTGALELHVWVTVGTNSVIGGKSATGFCAFQN